MKKSLFVVSLICAALILSACGGAAPQKAASDNPSGETAQVDAGSDADAATSENSDTNAATPEDGGADAVMSGDSDEETLSDEADFAQLAGTWLAEEGVGILTVYDNGGFLFDGEETLEGYLVYTDEDGEGLWDSGPRYELYLENNERVPNCFLALDENHPGKLAYAEGGGAELFFRPDAVYDDDGIVMRVLRADERFFAAFAEVENFVHDDGEYSTEIAFCATRDLPDFKFLSIAWRDLNENGSFFSVEELYSLDALTPERPLLVQTSFPGDMPTTGVSYTDADGVTQYFAIQESGYDGSLVLSAFKLSE